METLLITTNDFSERVDVSNHVADKYIDRHIITAQERYLRGLLGAEFYTELLEEKATGYWTGSNEMLVDTYITPCLIWRAYQLYIPHAGIFFTGMGPREMTEDNSVLASREAMAQLTDTARNHAKFYEAELFKYLSANKTLFPIWGESTDKVKPQSLPRITATGVKSRKERIKSGYMIYDKEED